MTDYIELHAHSNFSLLDGASHPEDLVRRASEMGMKALALTDHDAVYGALRFVRAAKEHDVRPIFGSELTLVGGFHLTLLVKDSTGWRNLCALISLGRAKAPKGQAEFPWSSLEGRTAGLIALSGCRKGEVASALLRRDAGSALAAARRYQSLFGANNFHIEVQNHLLPGDERLVVRLPDLAREIGAKIVATNNVHYADREGHALQDVLVCIRHGRTLEMSKRLRRPNSQYYLKSYQEMALLLATYPEALRNTLHIAEQCDFSPEYGLQDLPEFPRPADQTAEEYLLELCRATLPKKYGEAPSTVTARLDYELDVIGRSGLSNYFLIVWDIVRFARENDIRCQGRGSAANSLVAYLLNISPIDPLAHDLVFERFLSDERRLTPDIDIDFDAARREEVIQYVYDRYGTDHAAMACTFVTFQARSAMRDVGKALGLPLALVDKAAKSLDTHDAGKVGEDANIDHPEAWTQLFDLCKQIDGFPRHLGIHNGGMVITGPPLADRLPTEPATMPDRVVVQWDKDSLEEAGLVKIDLLGLRMLSVLSDACDIIEQTTGARPDLDRLTFDDPAVYEMISNADTIGVFQVESRAQAQMLPRMRPRTFADIIIAISLIRPGPIIGQMVHPYLRRRLGEEPVSYLHPKLKLALEETKGVILFQEQVLKVARDLAGFTAGQGEILRRALGSKHAGELLAGLREAFITGAVRQGVPSDVAEDVFKRLQGFGSYSFPKSHAAAFAVVVYQSAWLRRYHPAAFLCAILNNQPMGFWQPSVIASDAKRHNIPVLPVDIHRSQGCCTVEGSSIRLGLSYVNGLGEASIARIEEARSEKRFADLHDFCQRTRLPRRLVENLILARAMDGWSTDPKEFPEGSRRKLLWQLVRQRYEAEELDLILPDDCLELPEMSHVEALSHENALVGMTTGEHPMALYREWLDARGILDSAALATYEHGQMVRVAGLKVMHQAPPTAKGHHFITLEDENGMMNIIVRPKVYEQYRKVLRGSRLVIIKGEIQRRGQVLNIIMKVVADIR
jgi:error-prone DNA polymerase